MYVYYKSLISSPAPKIPKIAVVANATDAGEPKRTVPETPVKEKSLMELGRSADGQYTVVHISHWARPAASVSM